jgi:hypothetical protein
MSFDFSLINEDNYLQVLEYISNNRNKFDTINRKRRADAAKAHVAKYDIKVGTRFTYQITSSFLGKKAVYVYYLEVIKIKQSRASCKGIQTFPNQCPCNDIEVEITAIIPDSV